MKAFSLHKCLMALLLLASPICNHAQVRINGHLPFVDKAQGRLLYVTPRTSLSQLTAEVEPADGWTALTVNGQPVVSATSVDFGNATGGRTFALHGKYAGQDSTMTIAFTCLPIVKMKKATTFTDDYEPCQIIVDEPDSIHASPLYAGEVKHRGGTTNFPDRHKRNYHFKLLDDKGSSLDRPLLGMREDNSWLLDAGQIDLFRMRNHICHELWLDFSTKPYYHDQEPESVNGCHVRLVELFVNDEYRGVYTLMEPVDRKQLKLKKYKKGVKGCLWKAIGWQGTTFYDAITSYDNHSVTLLNYEAKYPEPGDDADTTDYAPLAAAVNFVLNATDEDFKQHVAEYFDVPVVMDLSLFIEMINGIDNGGKNCYWSVYDKNKSGRMSITPWDMDATFGQYYANDIDPAGLTNPDNPTPYFTNLETRMSATMGKDYDTRKRQRYAALRQTAFDEQQLCVRFEAHYDTLAYCGASARETEKWSGDSDLGGKSLNFQQELTNIKNWIHQRLVFLDSKYGYSPTGITSVRTQPSDNAWYTLSGQHVVRPTKGIYIHKGRKVVYRGGARL